MSLPADSLLQTAVEKFIDLARAPQPLRQIETLLRELTGRFHASGGLVHEEEEDEVLLYSGPKLTIYHITLSPGLQYPPHNHLMDAFVGIYRGGEADFLYPAADGRLGEPERRDFKAPSVVHLPAHAVHSVANMGSVRSGALHVYLGDLIGIERQLWRGSDRAEPFDNARYLGGARPVTA